MGKPFLALACLLFPAMVTQDPVPQAQPEIYINPLPPTQGQSVTIEYTGLPGTVLDLDWDPPARPTSVTIGANGTATVTVPANATSLIVTDPTPNGADAASTTVTPRRP